MKKEKKMIILVLLMAIVCLTEKTYAKTFTTTEQYRVYKCDSGNDYENCDFTSWTNNGTATSNTPSNKVVRGFSMNFEQNETLSQGGLYRIVIDFKATPKDNGIQILHSYTCWGSTSNGTSGGLEENIQDCTLTSTIPTTDGVRYIFNVTPAINIKSIKINIYLNTGIPYTSVTGLTKSNLSNDTSTSDAINNQTDELLENQNKNTQDIIDNQNQLLGSLCPNLMNFNDGNVYTLKATSNDFIKVTDYYVHLESGKTYYVKWNSNKPFEDSNSSDSVEMYLLKDKSYSNIIWLRGKQLTITPSVTGDYYLRLDCNKNGSTCTYYNVMISETDKPYCKYGSYSSKLDETNNILNQDHTYNNNPSQSTTSQENQMNNFEQEEDNLRNSLDLNIEESEITINPFASDFIWEVVNRLRSMSPKIVLLFTSILSLGIMKMILGR